MTSEEVQCLLEDAWMGMRIVLFCVCNMEGFCFVCFVCMRIVCFVCVICLFCLSDILAVVSLERKKSLPLSL